MSKALSLDALAARCRENLRAGRDVKAGLSKAELKALMTRYSRFEDQLDGDGLLTSSEVVLTALRPPRPYLHMMANSHLNLRQCWGSFWDGTRGGFSCVDSVLAGKMSSHLDTNYVPTCPEPQDVRNFWVHEKGKAWPMFPVPGHEEKRYRGYECRQGLDQFVLAAKRAGLGARLTVHVPVDWPLEVWELTLTNETAKSRKLSWFLHLRVDVNSFPFYYFVPRVVCEGLLEDGALVFVNHDQNNKHPRAAFLVADPPLDGFDMMSEVFDGWSPRAVIPAAVARGQCFNSLGQQPAAGLVAAGQFNAELNPGESRAWTIAYGVCSDQDDRREYIARVRREVLGRAAASREQVAAGWREKVLASAIQTPDRELDRYYNVWTKLQARNMSRFCHALDKIGYRDILQHILGTPDFEPKYVRARLAEALHYQFPDGRAVRQYEVFPGGGHDLRMYQDSPVWIPDTLVRYLKESGDMGFVDEVIPFLDPQTNTISQTEKGTVYEHAARGLKSIYGNTGFHGLCRIGYGDWNDALSRIGGEKGVSVWLSCACVYACRIMADLAEFLGKSADAAAFREVADDLTVKINAHAWDGQWYIYAINRDGLPIGSHANTEGRIHLNVNTWAIFSGVAAAAGREAQVWQAIEEQLATPIGHVLLAPPYTLASRADVGRIADAVPGQFENGSMYTHGESFYLYALVRGGRSDRWYQELPKTMTSQLIPDITTGPPHQQSNYAAGPAHIGYGQNPFSNFTGSLAWYRKGVEAVCGVIADFAGLVIAPRPPKAWNSYRVTKLFRGCRANVELKRGKALAVKVNGKEIAVSGNQALIPAELLPSGATVQVSVEYAL